jgi:hypothetical protein
MATVDGGINLATAQEQLGLAIAALAAARQQQTFAVTSPSGGRSSAHANLAEILAEVKFWSQQVARLQRGNSGPSIRLGVAVD